MFMTQSAPGATLMGLHLQASSRPASKGQPREGRRTLPDRDF